MNRIGVIVTGHIAAPIVRHLAAKGPEIAETRLLALDNPVIPVASEEAPSLQLIAALRDGRTPGVLQRASGSIEERLIQE